MTIPREHPIAFARPFIDEADIDAVVETLRSGWLVTGPRVAQFEELFASAVGTRHAVAVSSCTAALHVSLLALGIGAGDEVITTPTTYCATAHAIVHAGARPVFVDIDPDTGNIDPDAVQAAIGPRTAAILPVHLAGRPCEIDRIAAIAADHGLALIEDAAQAVGARLNGAAAGSFGATGCFSLYATKTVTTAEGGIVTTDDRALAERVRLYSRHGLSEDTWKRSEGTTYRHQHALVPGYKFTMTELQAALGIGQLARLQAELDRRARIWQRYDQALSELPVELPAAVPEAMTHARHLYSPRLRLEQVALSRDQLLDRLLGLGIGTGVHFAAVHLHPYYREAFCHRPGELPAAEQFGERTFSLPLSRGLTEEDLEDVVAALQSALN